VLRITIDIFSGRPNPVIELRGREAANVLERLRPVRRLERGEPGLPDTPTLGYRGLLIEQLEKPAGGLPRAFRYAHGDLFGPRLTHRAADPDFEEHVLSAGLLRRMKVERQLPSLARKEIDRFHDLRRRFKLKPFKWPRRRSCRCAPLYEPAWWNVPARQPFNNCYNYATNYRSDTFAQPGQAAGAMYGALTCAAVRPAAVADELIDSPKAKNRCPKEGHLVALVVWPGGDFHWYRKGRNGYWSHKPGGTAVTNLDNSAATIPDPRTADRGPYTDFCTFMVVMHGHIKIE
jgi:hypothetical protein